MMTNRIIFATLALCCQLGTFAQGQNLPRAIMAGEELQKSRKEIRMPDIDGYKIMKCDFHIHTIFSDGIVWPSYRVHEAWEEGLDAIAITEHIEGHPSKKGVVKGNHNLSFENAEEEARRKNIILIKGGEITRSMPPGHLNALFVENVNELDRPDYMEAIENAHKQGAFILWNHPGWGVDEIKWHDVHEELYRKGWIDGIEVFNEKEWYPVALNWVNSRNLTLVGNTDIHGINDRFYDLENGHRPMTLVLAKERSLESIKEAMFDRRTMIYFYNTLMGKEEYLRKFFEGSVKVGKPYYSDSKNSYVSICNESDVPFTLKKSSEKNGYPETISIPSGRTVIVNISKDVSGGAEYEVTNMIITPEKNLCVNLF